MKNRMLPYGYIMTNGDIVVDEIEAKIVNNIFQACVDGEFFSHIAEELKVRRVPFFEGNYEWNKNKIYRMIQDTRYTGAKNYPIIVDKELFEQANRTKDERGFQVDKSSPTIEWIKRNFYCYKCGKKLIRYKYSESVRWACKNGCAFYIKDADLLNGIKGVFEDIKREPSLLQNDHRADNYRITPDIARQTAEINRAINGGNMSFEIGKKLVLSCATVKFATCEENRFEAYTDYILDIVKNTDEKEYLSPRFLSEIVTQIAVKNGTHIVVSLINGSVVTKLIGGGNNANTK